MKAADIAEGDTLYWARSKFGSGYKAKVLDPSPVYGKASKHSSSAPVKGRGTGVLVEIVERRGFGTTKPVKVQYAAPLRQLLGKYDETVNRLKVEERATEQARVESNRQADESLAAEQATVDRLAALGIDSAYAEHARYSARVSLSAKALDALIDALPEGWQMPTEDEES